MFAWFWQTTFLPLQKRQIMANNYINRYAWLIDVVRRHGFITLTDISDLWQRSVLNETGEPLPERTFHNHRKAIEEILGIEILFNKSRGYYLDMSQVCSPEMTEWLLTSLTVNSAIKESCDLKDRIIFEDVPSGRKYLTYLIYSMKESRTVEVVYHKFEAPAPKAYLLSPYCLKVFNQRWYVLARDEGSGYLKIFALDRMHEVRLTQRKYTLPEDFSAEEYFNGYFGVVVDDEIKPQLIKFKAWGKQRDYFNTLPLNSSMKEVEKYDNYSVFTCHIAPTWDLEMELLQYNDMVEILEPLSMRESMIEHIQNMLDLYCSN